MEEGEGLGTRLGHTYLRVRVGGARKERGDEGDRLAGHTYLRVRVRMARETTFKASHPKRHDLTSARTGGERRSLVRAHPKGPWRRVVKKLTFRLVPVRR